MSLMKKYKLSDYKGGWVVGDFEPSIIRTKEFEFMARYYKKGQTESGHLHKIADEITIFISGKCQMDDEIFEAGDVMLMKAGEGFKHFECIEDATTAVIKTPSVIGDKYPI
jgi:redox-sensitive bicupin YhaK (pirin superfamily)